MSPFTGTSVLTASVTSPAVSSTHYQIDYRPSKANKHGRRAFARLERPILR